MLVWNLIVITNQSEAEYIYTALFHVRSGSVCQSKPFICDFTGLLVVQAAAETVGLVGFYWFLCNVRRQVAA